MATGETGEGSPAPLNPQARADINEALGRAGIKASLSDRAELDIDSALKSGGVDKLKPPPADKPYVLIEKVGGDLPSFEDTQIYTPRREGDQASEFSERQTAGGVSVTKFRAEGPRILRPEDKTLGGTPTEYTGVAVDTPDGRRLVVAKGSLSGATFVKEFDKEGREIANDTFYGNFGEILAKAGNTYHINELPHLIDAAVRLSRLEREQIRQRIQVAGGRDKYLLLEAQRLVQEGRYPDVNQARAVVLTQLEITPTYPQTEKLIGEAVDSNELPEDITDPEEVEKIRQQLDFCARYGLIEDFANKLPGLMRVGTMSPEEKARFAFRLVQTLTDALLGGGVGNVSFENAQQLSQMSLDASNLGRNSIIDIDILNYAWDKVEKLQQSAGFVSGKPRFRII